MSHSLLPFACDTPTYLVEGGDEAGQGGQTCHIPPDQDPFPPDQSLHTIKRGLTNLYPSPAQPGTIPGSNSQQSHFDPGADDLADQTASAAYKREPGVCCWGGKFFLMKFLRILLSDTRLRWYLGLNTDGS